MRKILITLLCIPTLGFGQQNPATSQGVFDINGVKTSVGPAAFMWDLTDAKFGQILDSENLKKFKGEYFKVISLEKYSKGLYFLQISTDKGVVNKKIIHQ